MTIIDPNLSDRIYDLAKQSAELYLYSVDNGFLPVHEIIK